MSDDELDEIREQKIEELKQRAGGDDRGPAAETAEEDVPAEPIHVDGKAHLDELVQQYDVVLTDFHADWCGPCKMLEPIVEELAAETTAAVAKVDVDANQQLAAEYGVRGVPTLVLFAAGTVAEQMTGVREKSDLAGLIQQYS